MGGATLRLFTFLSSSPLPLLHHRHHSSLRHLRRLASHRSFLFLSPPPPPPSFLSPPKSSQKLHTHQAHPLWDETPSLNSTGFSNSTSSFRHPWAEFSGFLDLVSQSEYCNAPFDVHQFVGFQPFDEGFLRVANSCLAFARDNPTILWSLSREDVEVVAENGSPFLFANASAAVARMKSFCDNGNDNVLESDKPSTVDLMKFLLSYAYSAIGFSENIEINSRVESSTRKLFSELVNFNESSAEPIVTVQKEFSERCNQASSSSGNNIKMKKGDWICPRCSFMNFAKNSLCLQCEEHRPKKLLTGGEWECPQCDFFNFGRNVVCLRCDCKKPGVNRFLSPTSRLGADTASAIGNIEEIITGTEEMQSWFTKIAQLEKSSDMGSVLEDEDLPETMKVDDNKFTWSAASTKHSGTVDNPSHSYFQTASDQDSIDMKISQSLNELSGDKSPNQMGNKDYENEQADESERWFKKVAELHDVTDLPSAISDDDFPEIMPMRKGENRFVVSKKKDRSLTSPMYKRRVAMEQAGNNNYVPFVPFPPDYFARKKPKGSESIHKNEQTGAMRSDAAKTGEETEDKFSKPASEVSNYVDQNSKTIDLPISTPSNCSESQSTSENANVKDSWREKSLEGSAVKEPNPLDMSEEAKAERWFRRVAQIKDISELSQVPDEDFPSIMPMRKGVNRFVVSKRKTPLERRLTSSQYRRNLPVVNSEPEKKETD
ncbi:zinc finger protein VAR3, chloroplastic-like [Chenopodium quinoa]|uniref:zinc finger protein VAR3, chloroplastic-like n=1 Tax=Chenopodium quinoa TaxID=63459 RepID=UPI000B78C962|nr:zinc finger protein VAR3, chloroplastic-like [Chenopodium quinoa]